MIEVKKLPAERWKEYRDLRLMALQTDPSAFGSAYEEEKDFTKVQWEQRMPNALFAISEGIPVGMIVYVINNKIKTKHVANIYGVYVKKEFRRQGIGNMLMESALKLIRKNPDVIKISLAVNPVQKAALRFYEKHGFKKTGILEKELKVDNRFYDEYLMVKFL